VRHDFLDRYSRLASPVHRLPAGVKLAASVAVLLVIVVPRGVPGWLHLATAACCLVLTVLAHLPPGFILRRLLLFEPFVLGIAVLSLLRPEGWGVFVTIVVKSTLCLWVALLLSNTTPFDEILHVLRRLRVPGLFVTVLALFYRYVFVLIDEAERMARARRSRTFNRQGLRMWSLLATVVGQLFIRSTERAERLYAAMCARGWR